MSGEKSDRGAVAAAANTAGEAARLSEIVREQAQTIAHHRKMFERTSAMAKIACSA